jgi:hypothetical protein
MSENIKINAEKLYKLYMDKVNYIADEYDWVTHFTPKDIVYMITNIIEKNPDIIEK